MKKLILITLCYVLFPQAEATSLIGRLGVGISSQLPSDIQTISVKIQRSRSTVLGGLFGLKSGDDGTNYALGAKLYRLIYDEPQLNFYSAGTVALFTYQNTEDKTEDGYIVDATLGSEFSFQGLESIGFSFEFGIGLEKFQGESNINTLGYNMLKSAVHFYL